MPYVYTLYPNANNVPNTANWTRILGSTEWGCLDTQGDGEAYGRDDPTDPDGGFASASFYITALPDYVRRITESAAAPPVKVRSWWYELNPSGPYNGSWGIGYSASSSTSGATSVSGGTSYEVTAHNVAQNPSGPRDWDVDDFTGAADSTNAWVIIGGDRPTVLGEGIYCDHIRAEVRWERATQAGIYDLIGPLLGAGATWAGLFGGIAHARLDLRALARWTWGATRRLSWDPDCDEDVRGMLRDWRQPRHFILGRAA